MRILFVARYRDTTMHRKVELLAHLPELRLCYILPRAWQDELGQIEQCAALGTEAQQITLPMIGRTSDPHRALYRTITFGASRFRPDIIHAEEEPDSLAALQIALARRVFAPRSKLVLHTWQNVDRPKRWYVNAVLRATLNASDAILCANLEASRLLAQWGYRKYIQVLPAIGVDTRVFAPNPTRKDKPAAFVIGYVGRLVQEKGIDILVHAATQIHQPSDTGLPIQLSIIGEGPQRPALEAQASRSGHHVQFLGSLPPTQLAQHMGQLDAVVLPSRAKRWKNQTVWKEQFGRILTEAMACKVPVIGSDSGAIPEVIGDAGLIFPEGSAAGLADCLRQLIESPALRLELADRGYRRVLQLYTQERIAEQTAAFYRRMATP